MVDVDRTTAEYRDGFVSGYEKGRSEGEASAGLSYQRKAREEGYAAAYKKALVKGFQRGCAVTRATGISFATGRYMGLYNQFLGRRAQLILLEGGRVKAQFIVGEDWEMRSNLIFDVDEWEIDQDSILEIPDAEG